MLGNILANRYEILELVGEGGMGVVYKARQTKMNRIVAIKMLHDDYAGNPNALKRFEQEAKAVSSLNHPNILSVYDFGTDEEGHPFLATEFLLGKNFDLYLNEVNPVPIETAVSIFTQTCFGLEHAHQKGIIHRDLKPSNLMLVEYAGEKNFVKVLDFGIAKVISPDGASSELTKTGELFGSPLYMSPEQCKGLTLDARSDIYSVGCIMYKTLTGISPLEGKDLVEVLYKHVNQLPAGFSETLRVQPIYANLEQVVFKAMAKDPEDRFQSMDEMKEAILTAEKGGHEGVVLPGYAPLPISISDELTPHESMAAIDEPLEVTSQFPAVEEEPPIETKQTKSASPAVSQELPLQGASTLSILGALAVINILGWFLFYYATINSGSKNSFESQMKLGFAKYREGNYADAAKYSQEALTAAKDEGENQEQYGMVWPLLAKIYQGQGKLQEAKEACQKVIAFEDVKGRPQSPTKIEALERLSDLNADSGDLTEARSNLLNAIKLSKGNRSSLFPIYLRLFELEMATNHTADANRYYERLDRMKASVAMEDEGARLMRDEASLMLTRRRFSESEKYARSALKSESAATGQNHPKLASYHNELGEILLDEKKDDEAAQELNQALSVLKPAVGDQSVLLIPILYNLARAKSDAGKYGEALSICEQIFTLGTPLKDSDPRLVRTLSLYKELNAKNIAKQNAL
jgi:serine/threonine protein kinase